MIGKRVLRTVVPVFVVLLSAAGADLRAEGAPCAALLTTADVQTALGVEVDAAEPVEYSPGFTVCSWSKDRPEGQLGVHLSYSDMQAIREGMMPAESVREYFDSQVGSKTEQDQIEPLELDGIGERAVLFSEEHLWIVMIELEDGFAHLGISPGDITRSQVEAIAKAVSARAKR